jgi:hypothetical protein
MTTNDTIQFLIGWAKATATRLKSGHLPVWRTVDYDA